MTESLLQILGSLHELVRNEQTRAYNEGVDAERARCIRIVQTLYPNKTWMAPLVTAFLVSDE